MWRNPHSSDTGEIYKGDRAEDVSLRFLFSLLGHTEGKNTVA